MLLEVLRTTVELLLLVTLLAGLVRVARGPTFADRMIVAQLFGTTSVAILLLQSEGQGQADLRDVAIIFALLSSVTVAAFVRLAPHWRAREGKSR